MGSYLQWIYHGEQSQMSYNDEVIYNEDENEEHGSDEEIHTMLQELYIKENSISIKKLYHLAMEPDVRERTQTGCIVNGVRYHIQRRNELRRNQNYGIVVEGHENQVPEKETFEIENNELHITNDEVYQDMSLESNSIVCDSVNMLSQLHRDDSDSVILDANVIELKAQKEHEVHYNEENSDQEDKTMIEYINDHEENEEIMVQMTMKQIQVMVMILFWDVIS
ncbi:hypothetical protein H5410_031115 [Solanum commersonii]|uniref:Uncharacterized protein n=1 Tax=Solanum commersonii TaxID=4109 RepID=A0A9J5YHK1_SOLCO|nr:hypothetical protein H5410_031115 [Solanum commersonii]